jgi:hypothetical protein
MWALLWAVWGGFWSVVAYDILSWPIGLCLIAMFGLTMAYWWVPNWWGPQSEFQTFFVSGIGLTTGMKFWAILSPEMMYPWVNNMWDTVLSIYFWGYVGLFVFKLGATLEAKYNPSHFNGKYLKALENGKWWQ